MSPHNSRLTTIPVLLLLALLVAVVAVLARSKEFDSIMSCAVPCLIPLCKEHQHPAYKNEEAMPSASGPNGTSKRTPVYFLSHGGYVDTCTTVRTSG